MHGPVSALDSSETIIIIIKILCTVVLHKIDSSAK